MNLGDALYNNGTTGLGATESLAAFAARLMAVDTPAIVVNVTQTRGSAPRERDTLMVVCATEFAGTIGGGHLEFHAIKHARVLLECVAAKNGLVQSQESLSLGPSLGQCCGGAVGLSYQSLRSDHIDLLTLSQPSLFHLNLFGAGHVGHSLVAALANIPCTLSWIDERDGVFPIGVPASTRVVASDDPAGEVATCHSGDFYLVMTHSHARDLDLVRAILARGDAGYLGVIGSRTKRVKFERRLLARGIDPTPMQCPIGLSELPGKEPWRIAQSVAADLVRRASTGSRG